MNPRWAFLVAAGIPCVLLAAFCGIAIHEWWLISTHQIAVIPTPHRGQAYAEEVPARNLLPLILGSGVLAALFAFAARRRSLRALLLGYLGLVLVAAIPFLRSQL